MLDDAALERLFLKARTHFDFETKDIPDDVLWSIYALARFAPTSANCCPLRIVFVKGASAKERLIPLMDKGNQEKVSKASVTAIFAYDLKFYEHFSHLFPHVDAKNWFLGNDKLIKDTAFRNSTIQASFFMMAARSQGVDCGPMSGFDAGAIEQEFLSHEPDWRVNFLCNLGYGVPPKHDRLPRFSFDDVCKIV